MNLRDLIKQKRNEIYKTADLLPDRAAELLVEFSALYGNCVDEVRKREMVYNEVRRMAFEQEAKSNRAEIISKASKPYEEFREAQDLLKEITEHIRALKYLLKIKSTEAKESNY